MGYGEGEGAGDQAGPIVLLCLASEASVRLLWGTGIVGEVGEGL